jgi:GAF domain-containing protein
MAEKFDYRRCWSFPMRAGVRNGSFAIYSRSPHEAAAIDIEFAELVTRSAGILIDRHKSTKTSR